MNCCATDEKLILFGITTYFDILFGRFIQFLELFLARNNIHQLLILSHSNIQGGKFKFFHTFICQNMQANSAKHKILEVYVSLEMKNE